MGSPAWLDKDLERIHGSDFSDNDLYWRLNNNSGRINGYLDSEVDTIGDPEETGQVSEVHRLILRSNTKYDVGTVIERRAANGRWSVTKVLAFEGAYKHYLTETMEV